MTLIGAGLLTLFVWLATGYTGWELLGLALLLAMGVNFCCWGAHD